MRIHNRKLPGPGYKIFSVTDPVQCARLQARMEPLGIIVFSCIMGTAGFSVILEAVRQFIDHTKTQLPHADWVIGESFPAFLFKQLLCNS
jgi:hypothetical protein